MMTIIKKALAILNHIAAITLLVGCTPTNQIPAAIPTKTVSGSIILVVNGK